MAERFLTTVVMTDIVGSTEHAAELGDEGWRELVQLHHSVVRAALRRFGGRELDTAGDGFFAIFDAPAAAVDCVLEASRQVRELGLEIRAGVHVGEVEQMGGKVAGITVPVAARIMAGAEPGVVLVSSTVRDLAAGSGLTFEDRGVRQLKGVPGEWHVYAVSRSGQEAQEGTESARERRAVAVRTARSRPIWQRRPRLVGAGVTAVAVVLGVTGLLIMKPWQPPALAGVPEDSVGVIDVARGEIVSSVAVASRPGGIAIGDGQAWITNTGSDTVSVIDLATRLIAREIDVGRSPAGIAVAGGSVWVANSDARTVSRINTTTMRVVDEIEVCNAPFAMAAGVDAVWVTCLGDSTVVRVDAITGELARPVPVGAGPVAVAAADEGVWVASADEGAVTQIDPATGVVLAAPISLPSRPTAVAIGAGWVWVAGTDGTVARIDAQQSRVIETVDVGGSPAALAADADGVWIADRHGSVVRLDPADPGAEPRRIATGGAPEALAIEDASVWVAARSSLASHRGGTLRVVDTTLPFLDPVLTMQDSQLVSDGLLGYRRVGGSAGVTLRPALATAIPRPTNGGRTWTFQLRPNLAYSSGEPVRPADFRRAIERSFQVPNPFGPVAAVLFSSIRGADACLTLDGGPVARCDLSAGILTDDAARTVTFELTEANPDFLDAMTMAHPVPEDVPMSSFVEGPMPITGPYMVVSHDDVGVTVARNPHFTPSADDSRAAGYPDKIVWTVADEPAQAVAMVERGDADFTPLRLLNTVSADEFARLRSQLPGQLKVASTSLTAINFNTSLAPFDNPAVRTAVSLAIDRADLAERHGAASITCQVLAPGWPGYRPYCPHTTHPGPGGRWQAPDIDAARRLIEASGTRGSKVVVGPVLGQFVGIRDELVTLLRELGYDATADQKTDPEPVFSAWFGRDTPQVGIWTWIGGGTPGGNLRAFGCSSENQSLTNYCDPAYDALVAEAGSLQATDPAAAAELWAEADRAVVDAALWVPLYYEGADLLSSRVGNYQYHPYYGALLDQLWVQ